MKNKEITPHKFCFLAVSLLCLCTAEPHTPNPIEYRYNIPTMPIENKSIIDIEDSLAILDTTYYAIGDTIAINADGLDSIFIVEDELHTDTTEMGLKKASHFAQTQTSSNYELKSIYDADKLMSITPNSNPQTINKGLFGVNLTGMFDNATCPNDGSSTDQWAALSDLRPESLRIFSGALGKFMHPYHDVETGAKSVGYGYNLPEIIKYFDWTDGAFLNPSAATVEGNYFTYSPAAFEAYLSTWMDAELTSLFQNFLKKCIDQESATTNYMEDFFYLVKQIETNNPGLSVKVIVCLNIVSETATECKAMVQYMRNNPIWNINVVGVELGNECPDDFHWKMMGFAHFNEHECYPPGAACDYAHNGSYWDYINGDDYTEAAAYTNLKTLLDKPGITSDVWADHDYVKAFKYTLHFTEKIGIPAEPTHDANAAFKQLFAPHPRMVGEWNIDLTSHATDYADIAPGGVARKAIDAYIIHPYLDDVGNWGGIPNAALLPSYPCIGDSKWRFDIYDDRLKDAFDGIIGTSDIDYPSTINFQQFIKTVYKYSYTAYNNELYFTAAGGSKELWTTEWNIRVSSDVIETPYAYINSFTHAETLQEWWLKNMKLNFDNAYRKNFFTYATLQNFAGGAGDLITPADSPHELDDLGKNMAPYNLDPANANFRNYNKKRTTYYTMQTLSDINRFGLQYLPTNFTATPTNPNTQPTLFIDAGYQNLYIFYTNVRSEKQTYKVSGANMTSLYAAGSGISFGVPLFKYVKAAQLYSTSGYGELFKMNACYANDYPIEINGITTLSISPDCSGSIPSNAICISVVPYSAGYVKIPINVSPPRAAAPSAAEPAMAVALYPNPATDYCVLHVSDPALQNASFTIDVFATTGTLVLHTTCLNTGMLPIAQLPAGAYTIHILGAGNTTYIQSLIKL